jgi:tRNA uracil 4-sulfurtransferase
VLSILILVHYGELALKGKNRRLFERKLIENIKSVGFKRVRRLEGRLVAEAGNLNSLKHVFGISWFTPAFKVEKNIIAIREKVFERVGDKIANNSTFGVFVKRADKSFPLNSLKVAEIIGKDIENKFNIKVNLNNPELRIYIEIAEEVFIHFEKIIGLGGLPVGVSGKVLCLLSGGIDSPVASYLMMKRGCQVDYIHFHTFPKNEAVSKTKIKYLVRSLDEYGLTSRIYLVPHHPFQFALLDKLVNSRHELVLFRRFMLKVAERIAGVSGYQALVTGDSLGQVASQTLENLNVVNEGISLPIVQPLISFDKQEIVDLAKKIGTYEISIKPYKDCCSIIASRPKTNSRLKSIIALEKRIGTDRVVDETLELLGICNF